jgi:guanosine-3',5'-bis(diphosphate) 3'-pyrophosphohydrolase
MQTAIIVSEEVGMKGPTLIGIMLQNVVENGILTLEEVQKDFGDDVANIIKGLIKTGELYAKSPTVQSDNFRESAHLVCGGYEGYPHYDCRKSEHHEADS